MYGAMIGDIVGSRFEFLRMKSKDFQHLFAANSKYTDNSVIHAEAGSGYPSSEAR